MAVTFKICPFPYMGGTPYMEIIVKSDSYDVNKLQQPFSERMQNILVLGPALGVI